MRADLKNELLAQAVQARRGLYRPLASPTGFPFKVAILQGSYSDPAVAEARTRVCDIGLLRESYASQTAISAIAARLNRWPITLPRAAR